VSEESKQDAAVESTRSIKLQELEEHTAGGKRVFPPNLELIQGVKVGLSVGIGYCELTVAELFALKEGSILTLDRESDELVDIYMDSKLIGRGELVVVGESFGVRVVELGKLKAP
jgi:flagellar motor switch protein FliN/FliY